jgi:cellulose synthase (UDP-forming)
VSAKSERTKDMTDMRRGNSNRISIYEAVGYTSALLMAAAVALGWFDIMIPWGS